MDAQKIARATGVLFLITFATSIPAVLLFDPILKDDGYRTYVDGGGADNQIFLGATLELILILANVGTALVLYPILRRQSQVLALGYVAWRILESMFIAVGILSMLAVVALRQAGGSTEVSQALVAVKDATFLLGPGFMTGVGSGLTLGYLFYRSGLIPRRLALVGLVGGTLIVVSGILVLFGVLAPFAEGQFLFSVPEIVWESGILGIYLIVKGFKPAPITTGEAPAERAPALAPQPA